MRGAGRDYQLAAQAAQDAHIQKVVGELSMMHRRAPEALRMVEDGHVTARRKRDGTIVFEGAGVLGKVIRDGINRGLIVPPEPDVGKPVTLTLSGNGELALQHRSPS